MLVLYYWKTEVGGFYGDCFGVFDFVEVRVLFVWMFMLLCILMGKLWIFRFILFRKLKYCRGYNKWVYFIKWSWKEGYIG